MRRALIALLALVAAAPAFAGLTYPVDLSARYALYYIPQARALSRYQVWPNIDGTRPNLDPGYEWLMEVRQQPSSWDSRFQTFGCSDPVADLDAGTYTVICTAQLHAADGLEAAVRNVATERLTAVAEALHITASDAVLAGAIAGMRAAGIILTADWQAIADQYDAAALDLIGAIRIEERRLIQWLADHPGQLPDVSALSAIGPQVEP